MTPARPQRKFEDLAVAEHRQSRQMEVSADAIIAFACAYDPQWFHVDADAARESIFGEVVASGVHVLAVWRQLDHEINGDIDFVCGVGFDELRLRTALRGGDKVYVTSRILELTPSRTRPDRGTAITHYAMINQNGDIVVEFRSINLVHRRIASQS